MSDVKSKLEFKLKQQTPMVHFQYNDEGAVIRGTELKPKLDRFLRAKYGDAVCDKWILKRSADSDGSASETALNYKVRVYANSNPVISQPPKYGMYFGNMGEDTSQYKNYVFYENADITLEIICLIKELREKISESIGEFFAVTNFGTRQSKGFGCFSIDDESTTITKLNQGEYRYFYTKTNNLDYSAKLDVVAVVMAVMKGGINFNGEYIKGYIQREYLDDLGRGDTGSDKAFIKSEVWKKQPRATERKEPYSEFAYTRALLGVTDTIKFNDKDYLRKGNVSIKSKEVERFKSPVTVSIVDDTIFFIITDSYEEILGKEFSFSHDNVERKIKVPNSFDVTLFIEKFVEYYNSSDTKDELHKNKRHSNAERIKLKEGGK